MSSGSSGTSGHLQCPQDILNVFDLLSLQCDIYNVLRNLWILSTFSMSSPYSWISYNVLRILRILRTVSLSSGHFKCPLCPLPLVGHFLCPQDPPEDTQDIVNILRTFSMLSMSSPFSRTFSMSSGSSGSSKHCKWTFSMSWISSPFCRTL